MTDSKKVTDTQIAKIVRALGVLTYGEAERILEIVSYRPVPEESLKKFYPLLLGPPKQGKIELSCSIIGGGDKPKLMTFVYRTADKDAPSTGFFPCLSSEAGLCGKCVMRWGEFDYVDGMCSVVQLYELRDMMQNVAHSIADADADLQDWQAWLDAQAEMGAEQRKFFQDKITQAGCTAHGVIS